MTADQHWDRLYTTKGERDVSWFEPTPHVSLSMLDAAGVTPQACVIDIGGGDSRLVDHLLQRGFTCLTVLDVSSAALDRAKARLGPAAATPTWIASDVTGDWKAKPVDVWHDRAVFHFLTAGSDRAKYLARLRETLKPGGIVIIATFALDGPDTCSGLPVERYSPESLAAVLGADFSLVDALAHTHRTPSGASQAFQYARFARADHQQA
jgi:SAM-dependent methyltransferase